jgi:HD-GYP domain-containing protein (c-di-GMP phosphodiesterase class II)
MVDAQIEELRIAAHVHDIGMLTLPDSLLRKPGRLSEGERELLRGVPRAAHGLLVQLDLPQLVLQSVVHQHERWDGSGYPSGLSGADIPLGARIIAVADALDAMTSVRAHREPLTLEAARAELLLQAGKQFDPNVVAVALTLTGPDLTGGATPDVSTADTDSAEYALVR